MTREKANDLIERYLYKVGEELPAKQRDDVKAELRSLLLDALEDRAAEAGRPVDEELAVEVVRDFGKPEQVAERYRPPGQYLIGPRLFPVFLDVAKIILIGLAVVFTVFVGLSLAAYPGRMPEMFRPSSVIDFVDTFVKLALLNLALLVAVFAIIERLSAGKPATEARTEWDPHDLPEVPSQEDRERASQPSLVFKIYAIVALFSWVNFFPETFGIWFFTGDEARIIHFSELGLRFPLLLMNIWWGCALALNVWVLRQGRWTRESRWAQFGLGVFGAGILYLMLAGDALTGVTTTWPLNGGWERGPFALLEMARTDMPKLGKILHFFLTAVLVITLIETVVRLVRILRRYPVW